LRPGITFDHAPKIKAGAKTESVLYAKKRRFRGLTAKTTLFEKLFRRSRLANAGAREAAVVFDADLAAAQQISHCRDGFLGVFGAGAHGKDEIAQGKFTRLEDLIGRFHRGCALF
jgi:hypothetical protein